MRKKYIFGKKLYISILTSIVVLMTTIATTFAWVGVFANSTFDTFTFKIQESGLDDYNIEISADGINFSSEIDFNKIKKQILLNWGYTEGQLYNQDRIDILYNNLNQDQATTELNIIGDKIKSFGQFTDIDGNTTKKIFKFDIYVSAVKVIDPDTPSTFALDVFLQKDIFRGSLKTFTLMNSYTYPETFVNPYVSQTPGIVPIQGGRKIETATVDSSQACRLGFEKYPVVQKGHPELYNNIAEPNSAIIYQTGNEYPIENINTETQSFGAILPDDYNIAVGYYNSTEYMWYAHQVKSVSVPNSILQTRGVNGAFPDLVISDENNHLIDSTNPNEQIGVDTMMKVTCYFWFEGWDADCFPVINYSKVNIDIGLSMTREDE